MRAKISMDMSKTWGMMFEMFREKTRDMYLLTETRKQTSSGPADCTLSLKRIGDGNMNAF